MVCACEFLGLYISLQDHSQLCKPDIEEMKYKKARKKEESVKPP